MVIETRQAFLRNLSTSWLEGGNKSGPLLLFLHGYPDGPEVWSEQFRLFSNDYHVICPYARGTFASEGGEGLSRFSIHSLCLDTLEIIKLVDPTEKKEIRVVGHDLGGALAWKLATYLGPRLSSLVIINSLSLEQMAARFFSGSRQWFRSWYIYPMLVPKLSDQLVKKFSKFLLPWSYKLGGLKPSEFPKMKLDQPFPTATLKTYRAFALEALKSFRKKPHSVKTPTLVLWGKRDPFLPCPSQDELEPFAENLTIRIMNASHWPFREKPEATHQLIQQFFNQGVRHARRF